MQPATTAPPTSHGRRAGITETLLRRSVGLPAVVAVAAVIAANVALRERGWVHEWFWAFFNYHFVPIFLGPLAAGLGAWEGARLARFRDLLQASGGTRRALVAAGAAVFGWILLTYLVGLAVISAMVTAAGTPGTPGMIELGTMVPALTFAAMWVAMGTGSGYRFGSPLVAPLATLASFAVILFLYVVDYDLVRVGGATASLLGLAPRPGLQAGQTVLYLATAAWAVLWAGRARGNGFVNQLPARITGFLAAAVAFGLFVNQGPDFRRRSVMLRCFGDPPICLAPGYDQRPEAVRVALAPYLEGLEKIGAPMPKRFHQGRPSDLVGYISEEFALGEVSDLNEGERAVLSAYGDFTCDTYNNRELDESRDGVHAWLASLGGDRDFLGFADVPEVLRTGSSEEQAAWLRNAIERLRRCA
ncbi:MAG: hypothetical protein ACRD0O_05210 [Acidimicrobiia bacterium]